VTQMEGAQEAKSSTGRLVTFCVVAALMLTAVVVYDFTHTGRWKRSGPPITVSSWAPYWQADSALASFNANAAVFGDVSMFGYFTDAAGSVKPYATMDPNAPLVLKRDARAAGVEFVASIIDATKPREMAAILADPATRAVHVDAVTQFAIASDVDGVDLDYENFAFNDGKATWAATRPNWIAFLAELSKSLHASNKTLTVSVPPVYDNKRTDDSGYWVYDFAAMGKIVDHIRVMAYDFSTSAPGPIAPLDWVTKVVAATRSMVPRERIILGVPVYGYDWVVNTVGVCPVDNKPRRKNLSTKSAGELAASKGIAPTWDVAKAERTFTYAETVTGLGAAGAATSCTANRVVWYADAQAVHQRAWLAERQDLAGIALWSLGSDDASVWQGIAAARVDLAQWP
jgi:spore germination protein YaaH